MVKKTINTNTRSPYRRSPYRRSLYRGSPYGRSPYRGSPYGRSPNRGSPNSESCIYRLYFNGGADVGGKQKIPMWKLAQEILAEKGNLHYRILWKEMEKLGYKSMGKTPWGTLGAELKRRNDIFEKKTMGVYGLKTINSPKANSPKAMKPNAMKPKKIPMWKLAKQILTEQGDLHITALWNEIVKLGYVSKGRSPIETLRYDLNKRSDIFEKKSRGVYCIREPLDAEEEGAQTPRPIPPNLFEGMKIDEDWSFDLDRLRQLREQLGEHEVDKIAKIDEKILHIEMEYELPFIRRNELDELKKLIRDLCFEKDELFDWLKIHQINNPDELVILKQTRDRLGEHEVYKIAEINEKILNLEAEIELARLKEKILDFCDDC